MFAYETRERSHANIVPPSIGCTRRSRRRARARRVRFSRRAAGVDAHVRTSTAPAFGRTVRGAGLGLGEGGYAKTFWLSRRFAARASAKTICHGPSPPLAGPAMARDLAGADARRRRGEGRDRPQRRRLRRRAAR